MSRFLIWSAVVIAALVAITWSALNSTWLRDRSIAMALDAAADAWQLDRLEGRLTTGVRLEGLTLERDGIRVRLARLEARPALERIFVGELALRALILETLEVELPAELPEGDPDAPPMDVELPLPVVVDAFELTGLRVERGGTVLVDGLGLTLRLRGRDQTIDVDDLYLVWPEYGLSVDGIAAAGLADPHPVAARLDIRLQDPQGRVPPIATQLEVDGDATAVKTAGDLRGALAGNFLALWNLADGYGEARLDLSRLDWPGLPPDLALHRLQLEASGSPDALEWQLASEANWTDQELQLAGHGSLDPEQLEVARGELTLEANQLLFDAVLGLTEPRPFVASLRGRLQDLSHWIPDLDTHLDLEGELEGRLGSDTESMQVALRPLNVSGSWNDVPARLRLAADVMLPESGPQAELERFELEIGRNRLRGRGSVAATVDLATELEFADLSELWPTLGGRIHGRIGTRGAPDAARVDLDLTSDGLDVVGIEMAAATVSGHLDLGEGPTRLHVHAVDVDVGGSPLRLDADIAGHWPLLTGDLDVRVPEFDVRVAARVAGDVLAPGPFRVDRLGIDEPISGPWQLEAPVELALTDAALATITAACLRDTQATAGAALCWSDGRFSSDGADIDLDFRQFALRPLAMFMPPWLELQGGLTGQARLRGTDLDVELMTEAAGILVKDPLDEDEIFSDDIERLHVHLVRTGPELHATVDFHAALAGQVFLDAGLHLDPAAFAADPAAALTAAPLQLLLELRVDDLAPFTPLVTGVADAGGTVTGRLEARGTAGDPEIEGTVEVAGRAAVPALALALDPIRLTVDARPDAPTELRGRLEANGQALEVDATARWDLVTGFEMAGRLYGDAVPMAALPELNVTLSPDLNFALDPDRIVLEGTATVPEARARVRELPQAGGEVLSRDVVIHRPAGEERPARERDFYLSLQVILGDAVHLSAAGLETRLAGRLRVNSRPELPLSGHGALETREGRFEAYGQQLELRTGRLNFDGPLDNPAVDVLAVRRVEDVEVGVQVSGFLNDLQTELHSSPTHSDMDTLTMLITGRAPGEATSADMNMVSDAALGYGLGQAVPVVGDLVNRLGIHELAVDSPLDEEAGAILVGTRLTDDISVRYTYGLHTRLGGLQIEYRVTDWLAVQSETGTTQAIDLMFRREFR